MSCAHNRSRRPRPAKALGAFILGVLLTCVGNSGPAAETTLPLFDTHVHYNRDDWDAFSPEAVIALMQQAGVTRALVSSTPDDGSLMLYRHDAARIVPILRPYRTPADRVDWFRSDAVLAYIEQRLEQKGYRGIGEFHLTDADHAAGDHIARLGQLAVEQGLVLHVHSGAEVIRALFATAPQASILWAHAGMSAPPALITELLDSHPGLWTEVSLRAGDIAPGGRLNDEWRALFLRHPDRFMIGSDTWTTSIWPDYVNVIQQHRNWLRQLPEDVAAKIAYDNAARLFAR